MTRTMATETLAVVEVVTGATLATSMAWAVAWVGVDMACSRVRSVSNPAHLHVMPKNGLDVHDVLCNSLNASACNCMYARTVAHNLITAHVQHACHILPCPYCLAILKFLL